MNKLRLEIDGEDVVNFLQDQKDLGRLQEENDRLRNIKHELERKLLATAKPTPTELPSTRPEVIKEGLDLVMAGGSFSTDRKISIIRGVRLLTGWTLKECKDYVETFHLHTPRVDEQ